MSQPYSTQSNFDNTTNPNATTGFNETARVNFASDTNLDTSGAGVNAKDAFSREDKHDTTMKNDKPGLVSKIRGSVEVTAGKVLKNPDLIEKGTERKTGNAHKHSLGI
ncbi:hypothetical protein Moror_4190 [Moniliophthora roreri MCA 2997]|uniref:Uncharacterized protein n=2 Tax=Moniliophthora roreri TaxID=221103 RepID=V2XCU6_MONRO|nr:hypothetical protein Moror_4190 [Moniliophthora roreri MCA 2997]